MNFLYPLFLLAAATLAIPVIIHLFNFKRYKKVLFPDIRFLKEIQEQTRKHSRLKHLLILACRILAVLALVFAFAQPYFDKDKDKMQQVPRAYSIFIDNSFSMGIEKNGLSMLDIAKGKAQDLLKSSGESDKFQLLTHDFNFTENRFMDKNEALRALSTIRLSAKNKKAETIIEKQKQLLLTEPSMQKMLVYISDFQRNNFPAAMNTGDSLKKYFISVNASSGANVSIDTAFLDQPGLQAGEENIIHVQLKNNSSAELNTSLTLNVNRQVKSVVNAHLKAGETKIQDLAFSPSGAGTQEIMMYISDFPLSYDDTFYIAGKVNAAYNVLILNQSNANAYLSSVFRPGRQFNVDNFQVSAVNTALFKNYSLVILNGISTMPANVQAALLQYNANGGSMLVFAPPSGSTAGINTFLSAAGAGTYSGLDTSRNFVSSYNRSHELFRDLFVKTPENIDLPIVYKHFPLQSNAMSSEQKLFSFSNGSSFLSMFRNGNGRIYLCASSAESNASTFPKSYWFLPLIYKMAYSNDTRSLNALSINRNPTIMVENTRISDKTIYHLTNEGTDAIPEQRAIGNQVAVTITNAVHKAGFYTLRLPGAADTLSIAVNYDRSESVLEFWDMDDLKKSSTLKNAEWIKEQVNATGQINSLQHGIPLWKVCIILALFFLLAEIALTRFMK